MSETTSLQEPRPRTYTDAIKSAAAREVVDELIRHNHLNEAERERAQADVARLYYSSLDGYQLAKELDRCAHWDCDLQMAEILDMMPSCCSDELEKAQKAWFDRVQPEQPCAVGTRVISQWGGKQITGRVAEVYPYGVAKFVIDQDDATETGNPIVNWEDVTPLESEPS